ncbi:MAG: electron transport complex subunit RsxB [Gammaproteobacteria bacterium]|nr:electron transport complex subunit RsxB [Gammaproteobacteria bacterium]MDH5304539.1 electron transport complex subunit RsxB [Gammaproteobacteria bacterium]MDH5323163.1 electron transport complex subunit RsxB [Gammaproteobacteria bacterium]
MNAVLTIALIALLAGLALSYAYRSLPSRSNGLVERVNKLLPQTQCAQCGYPGCRPYAAAVVNENAAINLCTPGGEHVMRELAGLLGRDTLPLASEAPQGRLVAQIDEDLCIGCTHCRSACPVDAIIGSHQLMHSIIEAECTGCELCVAPCPVDCISMRSAA